MGKSKDVERALCDTDVLQAIEELKTSCPDDVVFYVRARADIDRTKVSVDYVFHSSGSQERINHVMAVLFSSEKDFRSAIDGGQMICYAAHNELMNE